MTQTQRFKRFTPPKNSPHDGYLKGQLRDWHRDFLERQCRIKVNIEQAQEMVTFICQAEGVVPPTVLALSSVQGLHPREDEELVGLLFVAEDHRPYLALGYEWTPAYVVYHELTHYLESIFNSQSMIKRLSKPGWEYYHSLWFFNELQYLVEVYPQFLRPYEEQKV